MAINSGQLLQPATVRMLQSPQRLASGDETGYGLGWDLERVTLAGEPARVAGHDGESLGGMAASFLTIPERGIAVAVTSNISYADTSALASKIAQAFAGERLPDTSTPGGNPAPTLRQDVLGWSPVPRCRASCETLRQRGPSIPAAVRPFRNG
jgi:CubicO group peptidase (beta-lactamase class C family)